MEWHKTDFPFYHSPLDVTDRKVSFIAKSSTACAAGGGAIALALEGHPLVAVGAGMLSGALAASASAEYTLFRRAQRLNEVQELQQSIQTIPGQQR